MKVEVWSDVVCPWCFIGKRRLETGLGAFVHRDQVEVIWRSFELDPGAPRQRQGDLTERLARKYGMSRQQAVAAHERLTQVAAREGLEFHFERARPGNTFDAHRLIHLAGQRGRQDAVKERLLRAYFTDGEPIGEPEVLARLAGEAGLDPVEAASVLDGTEFAEAVRADEAEATELGVTGVPFFLIDRKFAIPGAQEADVMLGALQRAWARAHPDEAKPDAADTGPGDAEDASDVSCEDDACAL